ncbi:hypothetical protein GCM10008960_11790 [Deinococcus sedimenti]|uniref:Uncharacterized protein n=1 Tax=Deinococcus sedimenti TaxID=1867090 RepID=A0ABQ2S3T4_9DEIO|nr:hypothetical protein GCM10008960_11790 [Deinococcus sedimenti]
MAVREASCFEGCNSLTLKKVKRPTSFEGLAIWPTQLERPAQNGRGGPPPDRPSPPPCQLGFSAFQAACTAAPRSTGTPSAWKASSRIPAIASAS